MLQSGGHGTAPDHSRLERLVLAVGDVFNKEILAILVAFLFGIGTSDHDTDLVDRRFFRVEPLTDGGGELELPGIRLALYLKHPAFRNVLFPFCRHILPCALAHHTDIGIDLAGVAVQFGIFGSLEPYGQHLVGIRSSSRLPGEPVLQWGGLLCTGFLRFRLGFGFRFRRYHRVITAGEGEEEQQQI